MNILLLNNNPVVTKLVTLSAKKTTDSLDVVEKLENIQEKDYDLFVLDDGLFGDDVLSIVKSKTAFISSLYICGRDADAVHGFEQMMKKPFLPTDLVEMFSKLGREIQTVPRVARTVAKKEAVELVVEDKVVEEEFSFIKDDDFARIELDDENSDDIVELDGFEDSDDVVELDGLDDNFDLDDELSDFADLEDSSIDEDIKLGDSILDKDEITEVQNLLDEVDVAFTYDMQKVSQRLSFSEEAVVEFLEDFIAEADDFKAKLYGALDLSDYDTLHRSAHILKGVAANLGVTEAFDSLLIANQSTDNDEIKDELDKFYGTIAKLDVYIHKTEEDVIEIPAVKEVAAVKPVVPKPITTPKPVAPEVAIDDEFELKLDDEFEVEEAIELDLQDSFDIEDDFKIELGDEVEDKIEPDLEDNIELDFSDDLEIEDDFKIELDDELTVDIEPEIELEIEPEPKIELDLEVEPEVVFEPEVELEIEPEIEFDLDLDLDLEVEPEIELDLEIEPEVKLEMEIEPEIAVEPEPKIEVEVEKEIEESNIEAQIQSAVLSLSEDDLAGELDTQTMVDMELDNLGSLDSLDSLDSLNSQDIMSAIGEDVVADKVEKKEEVKEIKTTPTADAEPKNNGVEALKTLLKALSDKDVVASLDGMKISINITLGDN